MFAITAVTVNKRVRYYCSYALLVNVFTITAVIVSERVLYFYTHSLSVNMFIIITLNHCQ